MQSSDPAYATSQLGALIGDYRASRARFAVLIFGLLILAFGLAMAGLAGYGLLNPNSGQQSPLIGVVLGGAFMLCSLFPFWTMYTWRGAHAQLFERGFVISLAGATTAGRWEDITSVTQRIVQSRYYGVPVWTSRRYSITLANGQRALVNNAFAQAGKLGDAIQRMSANTLLPRAIASYHSGATLPFGRLSLSQAGISNGKETLPWSDLQGIVLLNGRVMVHRKGKRLAWTTTRISDTPNLYVLTGLVGYVQRGIR